MKNKDCQKAIIFSLILTVIFVIITLFLNHKAIKAYEYNNNVVLLQMISLLKEEYPDYDDKKIIEILNNETVEIDSSLKKYGIAITDSASLANQNLITKIIVINIAIILAYVLSIILIIIMFNHKENNKIKRITNYIKEINNQNYELDIISNSEDELSLLKNEIYKTAVTLNEQALMLTNDKKTLKDSLSDISHQLKTPLTSIALMVDTLLHSDKLSDVKRKEVLTNIHRKISNINFLVHSLLKLSKFDANTVIFNDELNSIRDILGEVEDNLAVLSDLKGVKIKITGNKSDKLYCDFRWQVEALTNIVKNCLEYSSPSSNIDISYAINDLFVKITIKDYGVGMSEYDKSHLFERFYKGENSNQDSIGIGLALAKMIIEKDNGYIVVDSQLGKGTTFTIKYLK